MPKKKNKKFKAESKPEIKLSSKPAENSTENLEVKKAAEIAAKQDEISLLNEKYAPVRRDVGKLLLTIGLLVLLFAGFYFIGKTTNTLEAVGNWVYRVTNIQIL